MARKNQSQTKEKVEAPEVKTPKVEETEVKTPKVEETEVKETEVDLKIEAEMEWLRDLAARAEKALKASAECMAALGLDGSAKRLWIEAERATAAGKRAIKKTLREGTKAEREAKKKEREATKAEREVKKKEREAKKGEREAGKKAKKTERIAKLQAQLDALLLEEKEG